MVSSGEESRCHRRIRRSSVVELSSSHGRLMSGGPALSPVLDLRPTARTPPWSAIGASIWHLARTPGDRERLVREPDLLPTAIEELLRAYAPVTMARLVKEDFEFEGCPMKGEDWILLSFPAANRDPAFFDRADEVLIDRSPNRHAAFGLGIHRCAGSHLARMELRVALEVWLENFPDLSLADASAVRWSGGQVRGPRVLPLKVTPCG